MGKFNKGFVFGGIVGAWLMWMSTTKKGKEMKGQILDHAETIYSEIKEHVVNTKAWQNLSKSEFTEKVREKVEEYSEKYNLSENFQDMLTKILSVQWKNVYKKK